MRHQQMINLVSGYTQLVLVGKNGYVKSLTISGN